MNSLLRSTYFLRQSLATSSTRPISTPLSCCRSLTYTLTNKSTSGYGDEGQTGDGPSRKPNLQGTRPRIDTEHPGREPVDEGKGTGSGGYAETGREETEGNGKRNPEQEGRDKGAQKGDGSSVGPGSDGVEYMNFKYEKR